MQVNGEVQECCKDSTNLVRVQPGEYGDDGGDRKVLVCGVCSRKHYRVKVDPLKLESRANMGRG